MAFPPPGTASTQFARMPSRLPSIASPRMNWTVAAMTAPITVSPGVATFAASEATAITVPPPAATKMWKCRAAGKDPGQEVFHDDIGNFFDRGPGEQIRQVIPTHGSNQQIDPTHFAGGPIRHGSRCGRTAAIRFQEADIRVPPQCLQPGHGVCTSSRVSTRKPNSRHADGEKVPSRLKPDSGRAACEERPGPGEFPRMSGHAFPIALKPRATI